MDKKKSTENNKNKIETSNHTPTIMIGLIAIIFVLISLIIISTHINTPDNDITEIEAEYVETINAYSAKYARLLVEHGMDIDNFSKNRLSEADLYKNTANRQREVEYILWVSKYIKPPRRFKETHELVIKGLSHGNQSFNYINYYLESNDPRFLELASQEKETGLETITKARQKLIYYIPPTQILKP